MSSTETAIKVANNRWITSGQPFWCASAAALLVMLVAWPYVPAGVALTGFGVLLLADRQLAAMRWFFWRDEGHDLRANYWERWLIAGNLLAGVIWGSVGASLYLQLPGDAAPLIGLIVAVVIGGRSLAYVPSTRCIQGFSTPVALAMFAAVLIEGDPRHYVVGLVILLILLVVLRHARTIADAYRASTELSSDLKEQAVNAAQVEAMVSQNYAQQNLLMDMLPTPVSLVARADGKMIYINQSGLDGLGISTLSGNTEYIKDEMIVSPEIRSLIYDKIKLGEKIDKVEMQLRRPDGSLFWSIYSAREIVYDGKEAVIGVFSDITARKHAEDELRKSEEKYRLLSDHASDLINICDMRGIYRYVSPSSERLLGYRMDELINQPIHEFIHPEDIDRIISVNSESIRAGRSHITYMYRMRHKSGHWEWMEASATIEKDAGTGQPLQISAVSRLVTDRVRHEQELEEALMRAEASDRAKSDFLAHMSHEIRTPLNAVIGFSEVMRDELFGPLGSARYLDYINDIHSSGTHLLGLINEVLDLSKIEAGKMELQEDRICLETIIVTAFRFLRERAQAKLITLRSQLHDAPDLWGDRRLLTQVLLNVIGNAIKFTPEQGSVTVESYLDPAGDLVLTVTDTGIGIAPEDIPVVMKPFGQARISSEHATSEPGTGLGLPLSESFVKKHGGGFSVTSEIDIGTRITITIPAFRVMHDDDERDFESAAF